jgi:hypothetical protein
MPDNFAHKFDISNMVFLACLRQQWCSQLDKCVGEGGGHIQIFVFTYLKNNQFQRKLMQNTNIEYVPNPLIELATPLEDRASFRYFEAIRLDFSYIERMSFLQYIKIMPFI